jgi:hypothetical protein
VKRILSLASIVLITVFAACVQPESNGGPGPDPGPGSDPGDPPPDANTGPKCGNGVCEGNETPSTCANDCKAPSTCGDNVCEPGDYNECPNECPGTLRVVNSSSYYIYNLYAAPCGGQWTGDQTGSSYISPGYSFTLTGVPVGCWYFRATNSDGSIYWQTPSPGVTFTPNLTYTWTLYN